MHRFALAIVLPLFLGLFASKAHAYELMTPIPCHLVGSSISTGPMTSVRFENHTGEDLALFWIDQYGERIRYATIAQGGAHDVSTYIGHKWILTNLNGDCLSGYQTVGDGLVTYRGGAPEAHYGTICSVTDGNGGWAMRWDEWTDPTWTCNDAKEVMANDGRRSVTVVSSFFSTHMQNTVTVECRASDGTFQTQSFRGKAHLPIDQAWDWVWAQERNNCTFRVKANEADPKFPTNTGEFASYCSARSRSGGGWGFWNGSGRADFDCDKVREHVAADDIETEQSGYVEITELETLRMECANGTVERTGRFPNVVDEVFNELEANGNFGGWCVGRFRSAVDEECGGDNSRMVRQGNGGILCMPSWTPEEIVDNGIQNMGQEIDDFWQRFEEQANNSNNPGALQRPNVSQVDNDTVRATLPMEAADQDRLREDSENEEEAREQESSNNLRSTRVFWEWPIGNYWFGARFETFAEYNVRGDGNAHALLDGNVGPIVLTVLRADAWAECSGSTLSVEYQAQIIGQTQYHDRRSISSSWTGEGRHWERTFFKHKERFMVGPVPMSVTLGVTGEAGFEPPTASVQACENPQMAAFSAEIKPYFGLTGWGEGGADVEVAKAGLRGNLHFLSGTAFVSAFHRNGFNHDPCLAIGLKDVEALNGDMAAFAEVFGQAREVFSWLGSWFEAVKIEYEWKLFDWDGIRPGDPRWNFGSCGM